MSDQKVWAYDLFSASFFLPSAEARFLMLMTALETMIEQGPRPDDVQAWVGELISQTEQAALDSGQKASQVFSSAQLKSWLPSRACRHLFVLLRGQISVDVQPAQEPAGPLGVGGPGAGGHPAGGQARRRTSRPLRTLRTSAATGRRPAGLPRTGSPTVRVVVRAGGGESADGELGIAQRLGQLRRLALRSDLVILCHKGIPDRAERLLSANRVSTMRVLPQAIRGSHLAVHSATVSGCPSRMIRPVGSMIASRRLFERGANGSTRDLM